jgi:hypothetical protein
MPSPPFRTRPRTFLLLGLALFTHLPPCHAAEVPPTPTIVVKVPGDQRPVEIIAAQFSKDQTEATITLHSKMGIFAIQLQLADVKLTKLTLLLPGERFCEGLNFWPDQGQQVELLYREGLKLIPREKELAIEITGPALAALGKGGKLQYINQYR